MTEIVLARRPADLAAVKHLFLEYAASLDFALDYQGFDVEMANFPRLYAPSAGGLVLARVDGAAAGAVGFRPLERGICELKRLFVRPAYRRLGLGRILAERIIAEARAISYRAIRLDTIGRSMPAAIALYRALGFREIPAYAFNPMADAIFMELDLS